MILFDKPFKSWQVFWYDFLGTKRKKDELCKLKSQLCMKFKAKKEKRINFVMNERELNISGDSYQPSYILVFKLKSKELFCSLRI